jgi:hypothetical protein
MMSRAASLKHYVGLAVLGEYMAFMCVSTHLESKDVVGEVLWSSVLVNLLVWLAHGQKESRYSNDTTVVAHLNTLGDC